MTRRGVLTAFFLLLFVAALTSNIYASVINVPQDHSSIQAAISAASPGDTVLVSDGVYQETIIINNASAITLKSLNGPSVTTIEGNGVKISSDFVSIDGFTLNAANLYSQPIKVDLYKNNCTIQNNIINTNSTGILVDGANSNIIIRFNQINTQSGWGIDCTMGINLRVIENTISGNTIASGSTGIRLHNCSESVVSMNNISNNYYGIADNTSYHNIFNGNIIENCTLGISSSGTGGGWSGSNHFFDNLIEFGSVGIQMTQTSDNYITMNEIKYMSNSGIDYNGFQSENNIISNNVLQWNDDSNVARGKPVIQSSNQFGRDGSEAVDGSRDGNFNNGSVSCTDNVPYPFWQVDLEFIYSVDRIAIYNRTDCCPERLRDFVIEKSVDGINFSPVVHHSGNAGEVLELDLNGQKARYLRVSMNRYEFLSIAEFEVYGEKIE